ncbi:alpha/beta hydrolase [Marinobacter lipolyticus]|uniref:alpha/beta fold hydrolase n=1 Tax=Marinobacter lipolyticus TaxID=209639 RepID=UPI001BCC1074|nr:alpha/beta hydrolase [Marinobacter lipolyticus]MBS8239032.1 alpha/beta hydrolase [Marinobacter lipolyticus]
MNDIASPPDKAAETRCNEIIWPLRDITLAGLHWPAAQPSGEACPILMLHGWLDNSLTFARLAPELAESREVFSVDMAGHGHSGHRPSGQSYLLMDYVADLAELVERHFSDRDDPRVDLVGHSLGGIVCVLYAAAFPEHVRSLVMIDSLGPISRPPAETIPQLRKAIKKRLAGSGKPVVYPDTRTAGKAREGGLSPLSTEAAMTLIPRNMKPVEGGFVWRTDPRLRHPSPMMLEESQVLASLGELSTRTLFIRAEEGLLAYRKGWQPRLDAIPHLVTVTVPGGHHCHLDGDVAPVSHAIKAFINHEA